MNFSEKLEAAVRTKNSCLMLGLDPNPEKMPDHFEKTAAGCREFCEQMMSVCEDLICGVKIQMAYFEVFGSEGIKAVEDLLKMAKEKNLITLIDGKRNDIGSTAEAYAKAYLGDGPLGADSLTVNPLLGTDGMKPFVEACEKNDRGIFVLVRTSNPSSEEFQGGKKELCVDIAEKVEEWNITTQSPKNQLSSVGAVVGATNGPMLSFFREEMPHAWILAPGIGVQGGSMEDALAVQRDGLGLLIPVSRSILYAGKDKDFLEKARMALVELYEAQVATQGGDEGEENEAE